MDYSPRYGHFRALLRSVRQEAGLSQNQLAERLGKPQTFVSKSELGERRMDFLETMDFCAGCHMPMEKFIKRLESGISNEEQPVRVKRQSPREMNNEGRVMRKVKNLRF